MEIKILCAPYFSARELAEVRAVSRDLGISEEQVIRRAVKVFAAKCVPTQNSQAETVITF